jgi:hypothetical protein
MERFLPGNNEIRRIEVREKFTDEEVYNLIAAIGNNEAKAITLLALGTDTIYTAHDLQTTIISLQGDIVGWHIGSLTAFGYCQESLAPIGLVALEASNSDGTVFGYTKTNYGKEIGDSLAGHLLKFSEDHPDVTLRDLFGATGSSAKFSEKSADQGIDYKKRSPAVRTRIYWILTTSNLPMRATDLTNAIGEDEPNNIAGHLKEMARVGIIIHESKQYGRSYVEYKISDICPSTEPPPYASSKKLKLNKVTQDVWEIVKNTNSWFSIRDIGDLYYATHPEKKRQKKDSQLSAILKHLMNSGYLEAGRFSGTKSSEVNLTQNQRSLLIDLLEILDKFQLNEEQFMLDGIKKGKDIIGNSGKVSAFLSKVREKSPYTQKRTKKSTYELLFQFISGKPEATSDEMCKVLESEYGIVLRRQTVSAYLATMEKAKKIKKVSKGGANHWTVDN